MTAEQLKEIISQMTLEEKAAMCSGDEFWHTKAVERLGVPRSMVSDGPHGLRKQDQSGDKKSADINFCDRGAYASRLSVCQRKRCLFLIKTAKFVAVWHLRPPENP